MHGITEWLDVHQIYWPAFIICARIVDVSLGTARTIWVVRGHPMMAAMLGFFEILVWITAVSGVLLEPNAVKIVSYGLGFALGNMTGVVIEKKLALGQQLITMISRTKAQSVAFALRMANYTVTDVPAYGAQGEVALSFVVTSRRKIPEVMRLAKSIDPHAFVVIQDVRSSSLSRMGLRQPPTGWRAILKKK